MKAIVGRFSLYLTVVIFLMACGAAPTTTPPPGTAIPLPTGAAEATPDAALAPTGAPTVVPTAVPIPTDAAALPTATALPAPAISRTQATAQPGGASGPLRIMALGRQTTLTLRTTPAGRVAATLPGATVLWVEGRSADGGWWLVSYTPADATSAPVAERRGWAARNDVTLFGDGTQIATAPADAAQRPAVLATPAASAPGAAAPVAGAASNSRTPGAAVMGRVTADQLNVRAAPGVGQPVLGALKAGDTVRVTATSGTGAGMWLQIAYGSGAGWVAAPYVALTGNTAGLPVSAPPAAAVATAPGAAKAAPPTANTSGKIAFQTASGGDIYLVNVDGSGLRRLTNGIDPALSPDGAALAFARWSPDGVWVLDLRTGQERQVTPGKRPRGPAWSADGAYLVFANVARVTTCYQTDYVCLSEAQLTLLLGGQDCADTPLGRLCRSTLPISRIEETGLVRVAVAGGAWQDLPAELPAQSPQWYPSGNEILYRVNNGLQKAPNDPNGKSWPLVVGEARYNSPALSPDGQRIAIQNYLHDHADLFILNAAGQVERRLTQPAFLATKAVNNVAPAWSPDGRALLFLTDRDGAWRIYRMDADGGNAAPFLPNVLGNLTLRYDFAAERVMTWSR